MKIVIAVFLLSGLIYGQTGYTSTYRQNRLVKLDRLMERPDCGLMRFNGPIKYIRQDPDDSLQFGVQTRKYLRDVALDLSQLANADRGNFYHFMLKRGHRVFITGYACGSNGIVEAMSISSQ